MITQLRRRLPSQRALFDAAPPPLRRVFANLEAVRRDWYRRYGNYREELRRFDPAWYRAASAEEQATYQAAQLARIVARARATVPHYRAALPADPIRTLDDLRRLPILEKEMVRRDPLALVAEGTPMRALWLNSTSGSTGMPLRYYQDRSATRSHQALSDALMAEQGCRLGERRVRISGVYLAPYEQTEPPFWIYIDFYRQLQCSAYHLGPRSYGAYLQAMRDARVVYGTGYATAWHQLAMHLLASGERPPALRAIFTDSEGITVEQQRSVERAFGCPVFQGYGTGEVWTVATQCEHRRYHVLTRSAIVEILDDAGRPVAPGETGQIIATDLTSAVTPFIRYRTGDLATLAPGPCPCGRHSPSWTAVEGRLDDRLLTPEGRWVRVGGHIIRPAVGVRESQIVQTAPARIVVRVVPAHDFDPASMELVLAEARRYLGEAMEVRWELADGLPRTRAGKLRHIVREI